jgi:hypothetical protein
MIPNILGSVGGAEKSGWLTHYHTMYFPFLIWAAAEGYAKLSRWSEKLGPHPMLSHAALGAITISLALALATTVLAPSYKQIKYFSWIYLNQQPLFQAAVELPEFIGTNATRPRNKDYAALIKANVRPGSFVTTPEGYMPSLYKWSNLAYYPDGLAEADYAIVTMVSNANGSPVYGGQVCYLGTVEAAKQNLCLTERMRLAGYDLNNPVKIGNSGMALLKRNKP